ncbi:MAG: hypothetical protein AAGH40_13225 [Verrucomicrobiota bacterium]
MKVVHRLPGQHRLVAAIALVHAIAWIGYCGQIELGRFPTQETEAILQSAQEWAQGKAPDDSSKTFYLLILTLFARIFQTPEDTLLGIRLFNAICYALSAGFCAAASAFIWRKTPAIWISGILIAFNPVLAFWTIDPSPALPALACLSFACWKLLHWMRRPDLFSTSLISLSFSLCAALNTALLGPALLWPIVALLYPRKGAPSQALTSLITTLGIGITFFVFGFQLQNPIKFYLSESLYNLYGLLGSYEPTDVKNYAFYQQLYLLLKINPIHWGLLPILAIAGCYARIKNGHKGRSIYVLGSIFLVFSLVYIFQEPSSTQRLGIIPVLAILGGGAASIPHIWRFAGKKTRSKIWISGSALFILTFSSYLIPKDPKLYLSDKQYLAEANLAVNQHKKARIWAQKSLEIDKNLSEMKAVIIRSKFEDWALLAEWRPLTVEETKELLGDAQSLQKGSPIAQTIKGIYHWKLRQPETALELWEANKEQSSLALLCLFWTYKIPEPIDAALNSYEDTAYYSLLVDGVNEDRASPRYTGLERMLDNLFSYSH